MAISAVNSNMTDYSKIASGKRINSAADDASGLGIAQKLLRESNGLDVGASNIKDGIGVANIVDGAQGSIQNSLQRIRELSVQASNGLYTASDKQSIQGEIDQLLQGIESTALGTSYNGMKLMDGSMADMNIAANPDGTGMKIQLENSTLKSLGLEGYNVTGSFDIGAIDSAMEKINSSRSQNGAVTNGMSSAYNYNTRASLELIGARSRIEDLDMAKAVSEQKKNKVLEDYQIGMQKKKADDNSQILKMFGSV